MKTKLRLKSGLALLLTLVMLFSVMTPMMSFTATALEVDVENIGANTKLTSKTDYAVAPGITESHIITHNKDGSNQVQSYALEIDLNNPNVGLIAGFKNYMNDLASTPEWGMQTVRDQAIAAEDYHKTTLNKPYFEVVGGINSDFFDMTTGRPLGSLVMNGVQYQETTTGYNSSYFAILEDGTPVIGSGEIPENAVEVVGGSYILVKDGIIDPNIKDNPDVFPRTSIGITADGKVILVTADGRQAPSSCGQTLEENAQQMLSLGCVSAVQVDGGGSATLVSQREGETSLSVRNSPSDGIERIVSTSLLVYSNATPDGVFHHANLDPVNKLYTPGSTVEFSATAVDGSGATAELPAEGFFALADETAGIIDPTTGVFTAAADFIGDVVVNYMVGEEVKGTTTVKIVIPDELSVANTEQTVGPGVTTDFGIVAKYQDRDVKMKAGDIEWAIAPQNTSATEEETCYVLVRTENFDAYSNKAIFGKYPKTADYKSNYYVKTPVVISKDDDYAIIKYIARSPSYPDCDIDSIIRDNIVGDANILAYGYVPETLYFDAGFAGSFNGLTFTGASEGSYNALITAKLKCNDGIDPLELTVFIGSKQTMMYDFEYVTGDENKDAENYIPSFTLPTYGKQWLADNGESNGTISAKLYEEGMPLYMWPNGAISNDTVSAEIVSAADGEPVRFGDKSLRISFDFASYQSGQNGNFYLRVTDPPYEFEGSPTAMGCWVYAPEGTTAYHLYLQCSGNTDVANNSGVTSYQQLTSPEAMGTDKAGISWTGWRYLEFDLTGLKDYSGKLNVGGSYEPYGMYQSNGVFWISYQPSNMGENVTADTIYVDDITLIYGANTSDTHNPVINYVGDFAEQIVDGETVYTSNRNTFKAQYADFVDKYMTGIDDTATKMYIDGVDVTPMCYIDEGNDEIYFYDAVLPDGEHVIEIEVADVFGNKTTEMRYFTIDSDSEDTEVAFEAANTPVLGEDYIIDIVTNNAADIASADIEVKVLSFFTSYWKNVTVVPAPGFKLDGEAVYNEIRGTLTFRLVKDTESAVFALRQDKLASVVTKVPADTPEKLEVTHRISKGALTYVSGLSETISAFSGKVISVCEAPLVISADAMLVGTAGGNIYVKDSAGNPVEGAEIYADGTLLGTTDVEGKFFTDVFVDAVKNFTLTAEKKVEITPADPENGVEAVYNVLRSFTYKSQSYESKGDETGLPTYIKFNATETPWSAQSISWMSNPLYTADKAIVRYAEKAVYDANVAEGTETAFTEFTGKSFLAVTNYTVRFNSVDFSGLKDNTEYVFMVGDGTNWSEIRTFKTSKDKTATNFFVIADIQTTTNDEISKVNADLGNKGVNFDFGIHTGDIVDNAGDYAYWEAAGAAFSTGVLGSTDIFHTMGNHEYTGDFYGANASHYYDLPGSDDAAPEVYSVEYGNIYIASMGFLNNLDKYAAALEWIKEDAAKSDATWKVLAVHQPPYYTNPGGATKGYRELVTEAADEMGLDFVFSGHDHAYARTQPITAGTPDAENGTVYYVCGSVGGKGYDFTEEPAHYYVSHMDYKSYSSVYLKANVTDTEFTVEAYASTPEAPDVFNCIDSYTATKTVDCTTDGHDWMLDNGWLVCSVCGFTKEVADYTGLVKDAETGRNMKLVDGVPVTGWVEDNGAIYYFDENGVAGAGDTEIATPNGTFTYPLDENGKLTRFAFLLPDGNLKTNSWQDERYLGEDGLAVTGEYEVTEEVRVNINDGAATEERTLEYTFDDEGNLIKGAFYTDDDFNYFYYIAGQPQRGWINIDGDWYYFDRQRGGAMAHLGLDGKISTDKVKDGKYPIVSSDETELLFTFDEDGVLIEGAFAETAQGTVYYWADNEMVTGWVKIGDDFYYFNPYAVTGEQTIDNKVYTFTEEGVLALTEENFLYDGLYYYFDAESQIFAKHIKTHAYVKYEIKGKEPTCEDPGYTAGEQCRSCGEKLIPVVNLPKNGHTEEILPAVEPKCEETGLTEGKKCSVCDKVLEPQTEVPKKGHDCDAVVTEPTCTEGGYTTYTCTVCGHSYTADETPEAGHDYVAVLTEPTCTADGLRVYTCAVCGDTYDEVVEATGHNGVWETETEPDIGVEGVKYLICTECGEILDEEKIPALEEESSEEIEAPETTTKEETTTKKPETTTKKPETTTKKPETTTKKPETTTKPPVKVKLGDANGDGKISAQDARRALRIAAKLEPNATNNQIIAADVVADGKITAKDARLILRVSAHLQPESDFGKKA